MAPLKLTPLELQIMKAFWDHGATSIREVQEAFPEAARPAYTTVQTTIYRLEAKNAVRRVKKISNAHIFEAVISRSAAQRRLIDEPEAPAGHPPRSDRSVIARDPRQKSRHPGQRSGGREVAQRGERRRAGRMAVSGHRLAIVLARLGFGSAEELVGQPTKRIPWRRKRGRGSASSRRRCSCSGSTVTSGRRSPTSSRHPSGSAPRRSRRRAGGHG